MKRIVLVLFLAIFLFSSCSESLILKGSKQGIKDKDNTGYGLEVSFNFNEKDIGIGKIYYILELKNSGKEPVIITRKNFNFETLEEIEGSLVFTGDSINEFYDRIFQDGNLVLGQNQKVRFEGVLEISPKFYKTGFKDFSYVLKIKYNYKTQFSNNIEYSIRNNKELYFKVLDSISQAAPIQVTNIELKPSTKRNKYVLLYVIEDKGRGDFFSEKETHTKINNLEIIFRGNSIINSCYGWYRKHGEFKEKIEDLSNIIISKKKGQLILYCEVDLEETNGKETTKTFGNFEYDYTYLSSGKINLPTIS